MHYNQLNLKRRQQIQSFLEAGWSISTIALELGCHRSTVYRELSRNRQSAHYNAHEAHHLREARRVSKPCKLKRFPALWIYVKKYLKRGFSPEQIAGRMRYKNRPDRVCHETIYRFIYSQLNRSLYQLLVRKKPKRGKRLGRKVGSGKYQRIRLIHTRPEAADTREEWGHWEGDTISFSSCKYENVSSWIERKSRYFMLFKHANKKALTVLGHACTPFNRLPKKLKKSLTLDQGSEFACHRLFERQTRMSVYFCDPHSPWQKGSIENLNGRLRRYLPRHVDISQITQADLDSLCKKLNNTPMKCLGFMTPKEALVMGCPSICRT